MAHEQFRVFVTGGVSGIGAATVIVGSPRWSHLAPGEAERLTGGQLMLADRVENYPGLLGEGATGPDLADGMEEQAARLGAEMHPVGVPEVVRGAGRGRGVEEGVRKEGTRRAL